VTVGAGRGCPQRPVLGIPRAVKVPASLARSTAESEGAGAVALEAPLYIFFNIFLFFTNPLTRTSESSDALHKLAAMPGLWPPREIKIASFVSKYEKTRHGSSSQFIDSPQDLARQ